MDNKTFTAKLAKQMDCDVKTVADLLSAFTSVLREKASDLDTIAIPGFGNFVSMKKQERITMDSASGKRMLMPPKIYVEFVAGSALKKQLADNE